jgi:AAA domain/Bifunctional DNA primase/polymerase, N-terminal
VANDADNEFEELPECEPAWLRLGRATVCRKRLLAAGYLPLPVNGKAPPVVGWQDIQATNELINGWEDKYANATNTGILTRTVPAIDIDVLDAAVADELQEIAGRMLGGSAVRFGQAPKRALLFRADTPFDKISTPVYTSPDGRAHKVEVLCCGQQIVVHGNHPVTQAPYTWAGGEPGPQLKRGALPLLNADKAAEFIAAAARCMSEHGWTPRKKLNGEASGGSWSANSGERERAYAQAALEGSAGELAQAAPGERNDTLNKKAFRLGTMAARGWISPEEVTDALVAAADACGLNQDDGVELTRKTIRSGLERGKKSPHPDLSPVLDEPPAVTGAWKFHTGEALAPPPWLIKGILPETGAAILSGQWGAFKTTVALDLSVCVMGNLPFAGRYHVKRPGAVLYLALEGAGMLPARLSAIAAHHGVSGPLPFAWRDNCPPLTSKNAADSLCNLASEAAVDLKRRFDLPVSLIWIDTLITAAGFASGEDNDAAAAQRVMTTLRNTSQQTGALAVGIDHFGKVVETGTRGSSAKEGAADTVIAILADRELSGGVTNTRLAVRKQRDGVSGFEIPFMARMAETGIDDDDDPVTAPLIDWQAPQQTAQADTRWTPSMQLLRRVLITVLADCGQKAWPFPDGPEVCACDLELIRPEFYRQYPADGTAQQKAEARRKAFGRSVKESIRRADRERGARARRGAHRRLCRRAARRDRRELASTRPRKRAAWWAAARWTASSSFGSPCWRAPMANATRTDGRVSGTGQDTPTVCVHVPPRFPLRPSGQCGTMSCPVPLSRNRTSGVARRSCPLFGRRSKRLQGAA